jgi:hypothetical protein
VTTSQIQEVLQNTFTNLAPGLVKVIHEMEIMTGVKGGLVVPDLEWDCNQIPTEVTIMVLSSSTYHTIADEFLLDKADIDLNIPDDPQEYIEVSAALKAVRAVNKIGIQLDRILNTDRRRLGTLSHTSKIRKACIIARACGRSLTTWEDVGEKLRDAGCGSHTIWAEWGNNCDLSKLRKHLSAAGYSDVAPAEGMSRYGLLQLWRNIFPKNFSFALDILFPFLFPEHHLIGRNHHSDADTEQTALNLQLTIQLSKPPQDRNVEFLAQTTFSQWTQSTGNTKMQNNELYEVEVALGHGTETSRHRVDNLNPKKRHHELQTLTKNMPQHRGVLEITMSYMLSVIRKQNKE